MGVWLRVHGECRCFGLGCEGWYGLYVRSSLGMRDILSGCPHILSGQGWIYGRVYDDT